MTAELQYQKRQTIRYSPRQHDRLKQLTLALHNHHDTRNGFPPGHRFLTHPDRMPFSGWK